VARKNRPTKERRKIKRGVSLLEGGGEQKEWNPGAGGIIGEIVNVGTAGAMRRKKGLAINRR